jgi:probable HAF family extracellular repeat protein
LTGDAGLDLLEVADPVSIFEESSVALPGGSFTYHVTEAMFIDFYTRSTRSRSYNGQYNFFEIGAPFGLLTGPSAVCTGHVEFTPTFVDFPGATFTTVAGINNAAEAVGFYNDTAGRQHGFFFNGSKYSTLDFPGALFTDAYKINDGGMIVGTFADASGALHGFSYTGGTWKQIDFPGSHADTEVTGVNSAGAIVGIFDLSQPVEHAFLLQTGQYQDIANPFGPQTNAFAINDAGSITGIGYTDPYPKGPFTPFILSGKTFSPFQFPGSVTARLSSINDGNDLAGSFRDPDGTRSGMVTVNGSPYQVFALVWGNNDLQQICGSTFDSNGQEHGFIGTLPLQQNAH